MKRPGRRGIVTVEAALIFPVLLVLLFGLLEYGWVFLRSQQITNAARHGARLAILPDADNAAIETTVDAMLANFGISSASVTFTSSGPDPGNEVQVTVSAAYENSNIDLGLPLVPVPTNLSASVSMAREGPP